MAILSRDKFDARVLKLVNVERAKVKLKPLTLVGELDTTADKYAKRMATGDFFSHQDPVNGTRPWDRAEKEGYNRWTRVAENIAAGYSSPEEVVKGWMRSPGHRANILNANYEHIGIGYHYMPNDRGSSNWNHYWVQVFGAGDPTPGRYQAESNRVRSVQKISNPSDIDQLLTGTAQADTLSGLAGNDTLRGGRGNDRLLGNEDNDVLVGGFNQDVLLGGSGSDRLSGGADNDFLKGGVVAASNAQDVDTLTGGLGADQFVLGESQGQLYDDAQDNSAGTQTYALIRDFKESEGDRILLHGDASDYVLGSSPTGVPSGKAIFLKTPGQDELVAIVRGETSGLNLNSVSFRYLS